MRSNPSKVQDKGGTAPVYGSVECGAFSFFMSLIQKAERCFCILLYHTALHTE